MEYAKEEGRKEKKVGEKSEGQTEDFIWESSDENLLPISSVCVQMLFV